MFQKKSVELNEDYILCRISTLLNHGPFLIRAVKFDLVYT